MLQAGKVCGKLLLLPLLHVYMESIALQALQEGCQLLLQSGLLFLQQQGQKASASVNRGP